MPPRTPAETEVLLGRLKDVVRAMDASGIEVATSKLQAATQLEAEAADVETQVAPLRRHQNFVALNNEEREADATQIRTKVEQATAKRRLAAKERLNAARMLSLGHDAELGAGKEICVHCVADLDDNGDVRGARHKRYPIEDVDISPRGHTGPPIMAPGLRTLLASGDADLDPVDGKLRIKGNRVGLGRP